MLNALIRESHDRWLLPAVALILLVCGVVFARTANYGGDIDAYGLLHSFYAVLEHGVYVPSRFTGYPVAEVVIGALDHWGGPALINLACLAMLVMAVLFVAAAARLARDQRTWLLVLCLANHVLFFDSLQAMDYAVALVLLTAGWWLLARGLLLLAVLALAASCGARPNFIVFAVLLLALSGQPLRLRLEQIASLVLVAALFYVPVWMRSHFGFDWLAVARPDAGLLATLARFTYKGYLALGLPLLLLLVAALITRAGWRVTPLGNATARRQATAVIVGNLAVFFLLPAEPAYLQPAIVCLFLLLACHADRALKWVVLACSLTTWCFQVQFLRISYLHDDPCKTVVAVAARFEPHIGVGAIAKFHERQRNERCFAYKIRVVPEIRSTQ